MTQSKDNEVLAKYPGVTELLNRVKKDTTQIQTAHKSIPKPSEENWQEVLGLLKVQFNHRYSEPPTCIEIIDGYADCRFGSLGNFSAIIGKAKSGKTFFVSMLLAAGVMNDVIQDKIRVRLPKGRERIMLFDTEQSQYDVSNVVYRINTLAEETAPENFEPYCLRPVETSGRLLLIEQAIYSREDIGLVVIDGIRDLVKDINSADEATAISSKLLKWTEERNIHIIVILHQNKGDNNARGHLGTEIMNKAETVISVERDGDLRVVKAEYTRGKNFETFAFGINMAGLPYIEDTWIPKTEGGARKKLNPNDIAAETHLKILTETFQKSPDPGYTELFRQLKDTFLTFGYPMGDSKAKEFITYYMNKKNIRKESKEGVKHAIYRPN